MRKFPVEKASFEASLEKALTNPLCKSLASSTRRKCHFLHTRVHMLQLYRKRLAAKLRHDINPADTLKCTWMDRQQCDTFRTLHRRGGEGMDRSRAAMEDNWSHLQHSMCLCSRRETSLDCQQSSLERMSSLAMSWRQGWQLLWDLPWYRPGEMMGEFGKFSQGEYCRRTERKRANSKEESWNWNFKLPPGFHCNCHKFLPFCFRTSHLELLSVREKRVRKVILCKIIHEKFPSSQSFLTLNVIELKILVISTCDCGSKIFNSPACTFNLIQAWLKGSELTLNPSIITSNELANFCMWTMWLPYAIWSAWVWLHFDDDDVEFTSHGPTVA